MVLGAAAPARLHAQETPLRQVIDAEMEAIWKRETVKPVPVADDAAFLRRISIDLIGTIPTVEEATQFLKDPDPKKREKLIDKLLADPRYAINQANVWNIVLFGRRPANLDNDRKREGFKKWLTSQFEKNVPYDRIVRALLLAEEEGTEVFYVQFRGQPEDATVAVSRLFLGTQLQCARCHDHPFENWKQRDFYGMAGFFVRLVVLDNNDPKKKYAIAEKGTGEVLFTGAVKDQKPGQKGEPIKPKFLNGPALDEPPTPKDYKDPPPGSKTYPKPPFSRKEKLAAWVTSPENPFFTRAVANRVWAQFLGRGLVYPVDRLDEKGETGNAALLKLLAKQLTDHKYDLKWYIRELVNTRTYQLAAEGALTEALPQSFERARVRPLSAEELMAVMRQATSFDVGPTAKPDAPLPNAGDEYFLRFFGEPTNGLGDFQGSLAEHLFLNHSDHVRSLTHRRKGNLADTLATSTDPWEARVDRLFLAVLTRMPKPAEQKRFVDHLKSDPKAIDALLEEAIWVLLNTAEFRFNH
jgi:Protein of unknown function (DUF1549)/Protein of unknown function (DUF1553)